MAKRRRGSQLHRLQLARPLPARPAVRSGAEAEPAPGHIRFEQLVSRALASIPQPFARHLEELAIVIEDEPTREQLVGEGLTSEDTLYGLYEGVPRTEWAADWAPFPNKITLFRLPLEEDFADPLELEREVRSTVLHELAHHLGIDDDRLEDLGVE